MPGQGVVTIRDKQWSVSIANTPWELVQGLGGVPQIPAGTGMLFDTGWEQSITVTTVGMLFPLDVAFLSESLVMVDLVQHFVPGHRITAVRPACFFLEVGAGEMDGIDLGDRAYVELLPFQETPIWETTLTFMMNMMMTIFPVVMVGAFGVGMMKAICAGSSHQSLSSGDVKKHYSGPYLTNWQYGGYSYIEEDPTKPPELWSKGWVDHARPEDVIAIVEREGLPGIHLAGGFWEEMGYKGYGEKVSISEAKRALAKAREHVRLCENLFNIPFILI